MECEYEYVKDSEGYVCKKPKSEIGPDEQAITEEEYKLASGLSEYEKSFGHGGKRENAGRKQRFSSPLKYQMRLTKEEKEFITYARKNGLDFSSLISQQA